MDRIRSLQAHFILEEALTRWLVGSIGIFILLGSVFIVYRAASVTITNEYISQGKRKIYWSDVVDAGMKGYELYIVSHSKEKILISPWAYRNPAEIINSIKTNTYSN